MAFDDEDDISASQQRGKMYLLNSQDTFRLVFSARICESIDNTEAREPQSLRMLQKWRCDQRSS
jgi:hypothetical protein